MTYDLRGKTLGAGKDSIGGAGGYLNATFGLGYGAWKYYLEFRSFLLECGLP